MRIPQIFELTSDFTKIQASDLPEICIVTGELVGPFNNGGLGTSMTGLAELLSAYGGNVTIIYTGVVMADIKRWVQKYKNAGINLEILHEYNSPSIVGPIKNISWTNPWNIYHILRDKAFDVVHFNDTMGEGLYCFVAKRLGLAFNNTLLSLALHSPTEWILESNRVPADWIGFCCYIAGERISISTADLLWGPSQYLIDWLQKNNYKLPDALFQQQYVIPTDRLFTAGREKCEDIARQKYSKKHIKLHEIVFFGRLEERKGIRLFTSVITIINDILKANDITVVFLGKHSSVGGMPSEVFLDNKSVKWSFDWRIEANFGQQEAIEYLKDNNRLAVIASPIDNSPCTVYEVLMHGIPFVAARTGGIPELIHSEDHADHLFDYKLSDLRRKLIDVINNGISLARPANSTLENQLRWLNYHINWQKYLPTVNENDIEAYWAIYIDQAKTREGLEKTLDSIKKVFKKNIATIIISTYELTDLDKIDLNNFIVVNELNDKTADEIFCEFKKCKATHLFCIRSGVGIDIDSVKGIESVLFDEVDIIVPAANIAENNAVMPSLAASAAFSYLECEYDTGGIFVSLKNSTVEMINHHLSRERLYLGLLEELYAKNAVVWPYPDDILTLSNLNEAIVSNRMTQRDISAYASSPQHELNQLLAICKRLYRKSNPPDMGNTSRILSNVKTYIRSKPRIHKITINLIRKIFGNRLAIKMVDALNILSHI